MTTLLIDGDPIAYACSASNETSIVWDDGDEPTGMVDEEAVITAVDEYIDKLKDDLHAKHVIVTLSCSTEDGWRRYVLPTYKSNRAGAKKPLSLAAAKARMAQRWKAYMRPTLEADDILGILATHPTLVKGEKVVVSIDKDLAQVPGLLFNPNSKQLRRITREDADYLHMLQALMGDAVDGYTGIPGIGPVKAANILGNHKYMAPWDAVRVAYGLSGLTEEDALVQARVARILRHTDYNFKLKRPILWSPSKTA